MKLFLFGVTGNAGQAILQEALSRGHSVTAAARQTASSIRWARPA